MVGNLRESVVYDNPLADSPTCMAIRNGKVYIGGYILPTFNEKDQVLLRYSYIVATENAGSSNLAFAKIFPNPCTNYFTIENSLFNESSVKNIDLCDVLGNKIEIMLSQNDTQIKVEMPNDLPSGMYIISSKTNEFAPMRVVRSLP